MARRFDPGRRHPGRAGRKDRPVHQHRHPLRVEFDSLSTSSPSGSPRDAGFCLGLEPFGRLGWIAAFLYVVCGALRLGRFNIQINTIESRFFNGLPSRGRGVDCHGILFFYEIGDTGSANT